MTTISNPKLIDYILRYIATNGPSTSKDISTGIKVSVKQVTQAVYIEATLGEDRVAIDAFTPEEGGRTYNLYSIDKDVAKEYKDVKLPRIEKMFKPKAANGKGKKGVRQQKPAPATDSVITSGVRGDLSALISNLGLIERQNQMYRQALVQIANVLEQCGVVEGATE